MSRPVIFATMVLVAGFAACATRAAGGVSASNPPTVGLAPAGDFPRAPIAKGDRDDGDEAADPDRDAADAPRASGSRVSGQDPLDREDEERGRLGAATIAGDDKPQAAPGDKPQAAPGPSFAASFHPGARRIPRDRPRDDADRLEKAERLKALEARARAADSALDRGHDPASSGPRRLGSPRRDGVERFGARDRDAHDNRDAGDRDMARRPLDPPERRARARTDAEFGATLD